jgi:hypothetical protein
MSHKVKLTIEFEVGDARNVDDASNYVLDFTTAAMDRQYENGFESPEYREDTGIMHYTIQQEPT